jgi:formylglycine-generating enzyme required for sulfatase activity
MTGNVSERCANPFARNPEERALRGGGWYSNAWACRTAHRRPATPGAFGYTVGFRVCVEWK